MSTRSFPPPHRLPLLAERAHAHRNSASPPEELLWRALRCRQLGVEFRRQVPVGPRFIADFLAFEVRLIVEVDGRHHEKCRHADRRRDEKLARAGFRVVRIPAARVQRELPAVLMQLRAAIAR